MSTIVPLRNLERDAIMNALTELKNDKPAVARALGISLKALYNKLHRHGLASVHVRLFRPKGVMLA